MKINFKSVLYFALSISTLLFSCKKNENAIETPSGNRGTNKSKINTTIVGVIVDESGSPISGAQVSVGTTVQFTDNNGSFIFDNINTNKERTFVKVSKPGFFDGSRVVKPFENQLTKISVMLQSNAYDGVISGTTGGSVSLTNGAKVELPANGVVVEATGLTYTGSVNVSMAYLDAGSSNIGVLAPGDMMAIDVNGDRRTLTSYGMLNVELTGDAGEKLQVANGSQATITIPTTISSAPSTIPLWYFDVDEGIWKEEGSATLQGNNYVGTVNHFTTWNCDWPERPVSVSGTILDCDRNPLVGVRIEIRRESNGAYIGSTYTDSAGFYQGDVPFGVGLTLNVVVGVSNCIISPNLYTTNLGYYTSNQVIPPIFVCGYNGTLIQGEIKNNCDVNAYAKIEIYELNTSNLLEVVYGNYSYSSVLCSSVIGVDIIATSFNGQKDTVSINSLNTNHLNLADTVRFCDSNSIELYEYIVYNLDGNWDTIRVQEILHSFDSVFPTGDTILTKVLGSSDGLAFFNFNVMQTSNDTSITFLYFKSVSLNEAFYIFDGASSNPIPGAQNIDNQSLSISVSDFGLASGTVFKGVFSGNFVDTNNVTRNLSGSFHLLKN